MRGYKKLKPEEQKKIDAISVTLPNLFGLSPNQYIIPLYGICIALILFLVLFLPGILYPGSYLKIESPVKGSAVFIDNVRSGITPLEVFVPKGKHVIEARYENIATKKLEIDFAPQVFASLFSYARTTVKIDQTFANEGEFLKSGVKDFSRWSIAPYFKKDSDGKTVSNMDMRFDQIGDGHTYHRPSILVPLLQNTLALNPQAKDELQSVLYACLPYLVDEASTLDWLDAAQTVGFKNDDIVALFKELSLPKEVVDALAAKIPTFKNEARAMVYQARELGSQSIAGQNFVEFELGSKKLLVQNTELSVSLWNEFTKAHPEWSAEARTALLAKGLVDEAYLQNLELKKSTGSQAVNQVSYESVLAFLNWYSQKLPQNLTSQGYVASLPTKSLWLAVDALVAKKANNGPWLADDQVFDFTASNTTGFLPSWRGGVFEFGLLGEGQNSSDTAPAIEKAMEAYPGYFKSLLGGGKSIEAARFDPSLHYGFPANWTSESVGFRIWIVQKN